MKLQHIALDQLKASSLNVRKKGGKDVSDLTSSIRSLGLLQPLLVRKNCEGFDILAGQRRYNALIALAEEGTAEPVPCIVMEEGDDARAVEASLAENIARLPMDEIDQYKAFAALRESGVSVEDIAAKFGVTERMVEQRLAIANIIPPILNAYRSDKIGPETLRTLTMATPKQQNAWWKLFTSKDDYAPTGRALKSWLFGGAQIPVSNALFDIASYEGGIVSDLFGEESYFADSTEFWTMQNAAVGEAANRYREAGWADVVMLDVGDHFHRWDHQKTTKKKGGKIFVAVSADGETTFHEGFLSHKEIRQKAKAVQSVADNELHVVKPERPELTKPMHNYLGLHRHAAVRIGLVNEHGIALRLAVAHMIAGSAIWSVKAHDGRTDSDAIAQSVSSGAAAKEFSEITPAIRVLLELDADEEAATIVPRRQDYGVSHDIEPLFAVLMTKSDETVLRILAYVMAETLQAHTPMIDVLGAVLKTGMCTIWQPDQAFFDLLRDKEAINAMVREVAGDKTADAHAASTAKVQKKIIADCLSGHGREKVEGWLPRYMTFPASGYTTRFAEAKPSADMSLDDDIE